MDAFAPTRLSRVRRLHKRGHYDRDTIHAVLDAGFICHVGYVVDGAPLVTPTSYWREGDRLYWHGSSASRMLRTLAPGIPACLTVTHVDGLVVARSGFHHSINYRSVMTFGIARRIEEPEAKRAALEAFVERVYPGRWRELRAMTAKEAKATIVLEMPIDQASAKIRVGPPVDDEEDYALPLWAGVIPLRTMVGEAVPDPRLGAGIRRPASLEAFAPGVALEGVLARYLAPAHHEARRPPS